jgi:hypothetical protein
MDSQTARLIKLTMKPNKLTSGSDSHNVDMNLTFSHPIEPSPL